MGIIHLNEKTMTKEELMHRAIELSKNSVKTGGGLNTIL